MPMAEKSRTAMVVETGKQKEKNKKRKCFHCGQVGHRAADCSSGSRTAEGQEAFQSFLNRRTELVVLAHDANKDPQQSQQSPLHHYHRLVAWMQLQQSSLASPPIRIICDPIRLLPQLLRPVAADHDQHDPDDIITSCSTLPKSLAKDIHHSYREIFHMTMEALGPLLRERLWDPNQGLVKGMVDQKYENGHDDDPTTTLSNVNDCYSEYDVNWHDTLLLNQAVREGRPANFSNQDAIRSYTLDKLAPRCRYLHHLILDHNPISDHLRTKFLLPSSSNECNNTNENVLQVCSLGGGPGYDHLSLSLVARFLCQIQSSHDDHPCLLYRRRIIQTRVFDLYDTDWRPIMTTLDQSFRDTTTQLDSRSSSDCKPNPTTYNDCTDKNDGGDADSLVKPMEHLELTSTSTVATVVETTVTATARERCEDRITMHHADLRVSMEDPVNRELLETLPRADVIVCQFVLHENASFLLERQEKHPTEMGGAMKHVLMYGKVGSFLICTDSGHALWPALKRTATTHGWIYMGNAEKPHNIIMGPKSFVILERTHHIPVPVRTS